MYALLLYLVFVDVFHCGLLLCVDLFCIIVQLSASLGLGVQYDKWQKLRYVVRGKKEFPVTADGMVKFHVKGRCDIGKDFIQVFVL